MKTRTTPENIIELHEQDIFIFGSNLEGQHDGGAALYAKNNFGAKQGIGEGITGKCYAFPTMDLHPEHWDERIERLYDTCNSKPNNTFYLTKVGCGIAGYKEEDIISQFNKFVLPENIVMPKGWGI